MVNALGYNHQHRKLDSIIQYINTKFTLIYPLCMIQILSLLLALTTSGDKNIINIVLRELQIIEKNDMNKLTPEELYEQSRLAIIAYLQDHKIKLESYEKNSSASGKWNLDTKHEKSFDLENFYYRIANAQPWYRVGLTVDRKTVTADNEHQEKLLENGAGFVKWITERTEYDNDV